MGFWDSLSDDYMSAYNSGIKPAYDIARHNYDRINGIADAATGAADNLLDMLGGKSNVLVYLGIGLVAVIVLPKLIEKAI